MSLSGYLYNYMYITVFIINIIYVSLKKGIKISRKIEKGQNNWLGFKKNKCKDQYFIRYIIREESDTIFTGKIFLASGRINSMKYKI